jgi:hypothetical protein
VVASQEALQFGKNASLALKVSSELQRVLNAGDVSQDFNKYSKGFLDVASARGVEFKELSTLFSGIIAGSDDALNRFGKADPGKLAQQYAQSINKKVAYLTQEEQVYPALRLLIRILPNSPEQTRTG